MSYEWIAALMFSTMLLMMITGQRVFGAIGFVAVVAALLLWGPGGQDMGFGAVMKVMKWNALLTLPMFIFMGYVMSESRLAEDLYRMFHVWFGPLPGGLAIGTVMLMVMISAMNGLSVAGMAIGATIALPELTKHRYDKLMISGVIQAGSSLGILIPPSVVLVLFSLIARQPVSQLWLAGIGPGIVMATLFLAYILIRTRIWPDLAPPLPAEERALISRGEKLRLLRAGFLPVFIFASMMVPFIKGWASLTEASVIGALAATGAAIVKGRFTRRVFEVATRETLAITSMFMLIIMAALSFGAVFDGLGAGRAIETLFLREMELSPLQVLLLMQASFLVMGMFLDDTAMLVIVAPIFVTLAKTLGFDLIWYGILYTITCQIAYLTPPFGYNLFLMRAMSPPEFTLGVIYRSVLPFVGLMLVTLGLIIAFPQIALWLPQTIYGT